jgi:hypothetical protein
MWSFSELTVETFKETASDSGMGRDSRNGLAAYETDETSVDPEARGEEAWKESAIAT